MLRFYKDVPATILCDNLKTAVSRPSRYELIFTEVCYQLGEHYQTTFSAARPYSPREKAMVEKAVSIVYTHVYAPLRSIDFTSLAALNSAMQQQLLLLNNKPYKNTVYSRQYYYELQEHSLLKPLPSAPFAQGLQNLGQEVRLAPLQLLEDRYGKKSIIVTSQLPVAKWYEYINDPTLAIAILDRLTANVHRIELKGESLRRKKTKEYQ